MGPLSMRHVTKCYTETAPAVTGWRRYVSPLFIMAHTVQGHLVGQRDSGQFARPALEQLQQPFVGLLITRSV